MTKLLAIVGPTASGKSELALLLSTRLNGEIVSADSRQIYRFLDIGTSKPTKEDQKKIPHHFVDILDPTQDYNAGAFGNEARSKIGEIFGRGKQPILTGGSGLYVKAVIDGFFDGPGQDSEVRSRLEERMRAEGAEALLADLSRVDPISALLMEASKPRRIIRALEVYQITGKPLSEFHREQSVASPFETIQFGLEWGRMHLYERINKRVELMLSRGLIDEVKHLLDQGYDQSLNALNTVGYKEVFDYLRGNQSYEEMVELLKQNTRRFAKRQLTWFRRDGRIKWIKVDETTSLERIADTVVRDFRGAT
jgi:tRNA dimethylallyltransferase